MQYFASARQKRSELANDLEGVKTILAEGAMKAQTAADATLSEVYNVIGIHNHLNH